MTTQGYTLLSLGWSNPLTDAFGAHPQLGGPLNLNDGATYALVAPEGLELSAPEKTLVPTGNIRTQGERITRAIYRRNRTAVVRVILGPAATYAALIASVRTLVRWIDAAPSTPLCLQWQPPSATQPVYLDVVGAAHGIPAEESEWLRLQFEPIELVFLVRPGLRGDRVTLSNLVINPGCEAPSGPGVPVFTDPLSNGDAYTAFYGAAASAPVGNVLTIPNGSQQAFGSSAWGAINLWAVRFQFVSGLVAVFSLHETDVNNRLSAQVDSNLYFNHLIAGVGHTLATTPAALTNGSWYWITMSQFPAAPGTPADVQATIYADAGGSIGALLATIGPVASYDGVTALSGRPTLGAAGANMAIGGAHPGVHALSLFGPGAWTFASFGSGVASGVWEQSTANTYGGGAVTSFGAARLDAPPAGTFNAQIISALTSSPANQLLSTAVAASGQTVSVAFWLRSVGLSGGAQVSLLLNEYDATGAFLRVTSLVTVTGNQAAWTQLAGSLTLGASTARCSMALLVNDPTPGASAGASVWLDNAQIWNVTTTGVAAGAMPYCELRFGQSPAQLLLTGLLGDLPAPAYLAWGTYLASWPTGGAGSTLSYALGRRGRADGAAANARLVGASIGYFGAGVSPTSVAALDATAYGGYTVSASVNPGWNPRAFSLAPSDALGVYHLFSRFQTAQTLANLANVQTRVVTQQKTAAWYGSLTNLDQLGAYNGPWSSPLAASNVWTPADSGQVNVPALPAGALTDLTQNYLTPRAQWQDLTGGGSTCHCNWQALLPIDGSLLFGLLNNPSNGTVNVTNEWLWVYHDGLLANRAGVYDAAASATYSLETSAAPNPAHAGGGPGTSSTGAINVNSGADPALTLDPTLTLAAVTLGVGGSIGTAAGGSGVNQFAAWVTDGAGIVLPFHAEAQYSPLYLYPR